jgi:hypothetical protein
MTRNRVAVAIFDVIAGMHVLWAVLLLVDEQSFGATALNGLDSLTSNVAVIAILLFVASGMAVWSTFVAPPSAALLALPQQAVLYLTTVNAIQAVTSAQYADGVPRSWAFILADQSPIFALVILQSVAIWARTRER